MGYNYVINKGAYMRDIAVVVSNDNQSITPIETINAIKTAGFSNVFIQWYNEKWEHSQEKQLSYIKSLGLNVLFAHLGYQNINSIWEDSAEGEKQVARYKDDIKICKQNGISMVVMHLTSHSEAPMYGEIGLSRLRQIVDYAKDLGIRIAFENTKIKRYLDYVIDNIKDDNVGICFDSGHYHAHFKDEFDFEKYKNRIFAVHLHDNNGERDMHQLPFDGTANWKNIIEGLNEANYKGPIILEMCYVEGYLKLTPSEFYKKSYLVAEKLAKMFEIN